MAGCPDQTLESLFAGDRDHHIAIRGLERAKHRAAWKGHPELRPLHLIQGQAEHRFKHGDIDVLAFLSAVTLIQRRRDRAERMDAGENIGVEGP